MQTKILSIIFIYLCLLLNGCKKPTLNKENIQNAREIRAIYVAANVSDIQNLIETAKKFCANAVIIDIKNDFGKTTCDLGIIGSETIKKPIVDMSEKIQTLKKNGLYTIARIVAFKDFVRNDLCIKNADGSIWIDKEETQWLNPYDEKTKNYLLDISIKTARLGFDEIQYDYIRFSSYLNDNIELGKLSKIYSKCDIINIFLADAIKLLHNEKVSVSVDVFGCIIDGATNSLALKNSKILGQDYVKIATIVDYICPMIYPSHFPSKSMGIEKPDLSPYDVIYNALKLSEKMLKNAGKNKKIAIVRPYLQAFTAKWLKEYQIYSQKQIDEQIKAVYDVGLYQWSLFNSSGKYVLE